MEEEKKEEVVEKKVDNDYIKLIRSNEKKKAVIVILLFTMIIMALIIVLFYFGLINGPKSDSCETTIDTTQTKCEECPKCEDKTKECNCPTCTSNLGEKISSVKEIKLTDKNQTVKVGKESIKIRVGTDDNYGHLAIDDYFVQSNFSSDEVYVDKAYVTDKFIFFTHNSQAGEMIAYAYKPFGEIIANNNDYQIDDGSFKVVNGYLHATGAPFCGVDGPDENASKEEKEKCKTHDLLIKYVDNTLIVVDAK